MSRYKLTLEYDGTDFFGWQRQDNGPSVQQSLEEAIFDFSSETTTVLGAGRTDSGVHALAQVAHIDIKKKFDTYSIRDAINFYLKPFSISVLSVEKVSTEFHARFSARERAYLYRILNRRAPPTLDKNHSWWVIPQLDANAMHEAAQILIGYHDFTTFRAVACQAKSPIKTLSKLEVTRKGDFIEIRVRARSFLHHQVRNFVGTLKLIGEGKWVKADVEKALAACDRSAGGPTAPARGLFLSEVLYSD
jgi:tRNA pseudouridine38-40 synthase